MCKYLHIPNYFVYLSETVHTIKNEYILLLLVSSTFLSAGIYGFGVLNLSEASHLQLLY